MKTSGKTGARKNGGIGACARRLYLFCFPFSCVQFFLKTRKKRSELPWDSNSVEITLLSRQWAFFLKWSTTTTWYWRALKTKMTKRLVIATLKKKKKNHIDSMHTPGRVQYKAYVTLNITGWGQRADFLSNDKVISRSHDFTRSFENSINQTEDVKLHWVLLLSFNRCDTDPCIDQSKVNRIPTKGSGTG